jgi:outer membrane protein
VNQPIFSGGQIESGIRQAVERENYYSIQLEGTRRNTVQNLSQAWNQLLSARANIAADEERVRAASIAVEGARAEQAVGLRTTLEVLTAEQNLRDAQLELVNARRDEYVASATVLNTTAGACGPQLQAPEQHDRLCPVGRRRPCPGQRHRPAEDQAAAARAG